MMRHLQALFSVLLIGAVVAAFAIAQPLQDGDRSHTLWGRIQKTIESYLGRPYVLGAVGKKSFDCSGFVWRIMAENGILMKRTTARKLYICLPGIQKGHYYDPGSLVFFDNMKHVGVVKDKESFYHAQIRKGTNLSEFDPYWRQKICGFRSIQKGE